jgi:hypothetical protein
MLWLRRVSRRSIAAGFNTMGVPDGVVVTSCRDASATDSGASPGDGNWQQRRLTCAENDRHFGDSYQPITRSEGTGGRS